MKIFNQRKETHINRALKHLNRHTYFEIGVRDGGCFNRIVADLKVAVDPAPIKFGSNLAPGELFFKTTSDNFFAAHAGKIFNRQRVDVALIDGLHEFRQCLQDVLNLEQFMAPKGVIFIHDLNPPTRKHSEIADGGEWNGDVWKVAYYLKTYRQDLTFFTLNCDWGLGVLTGFGSTSPPKFPTDEIIVNCKSLDYNVLDQNRKRILRLRSPWFSHVCFRSIF